jgi:hypothetical protein
MAPLCVAGQTVVNELKQSIAGHSCAVGHNPAADGFAIEC